MRKVTVLIPAFRVAHSVGETLDAVLASGRASDVLVVDDCCPDGSGDAARRPGVVVRRLARNLGKGGALTEGFRATSSAASDIIVLLDGDLGPSASEWTKLLEPIESGRSDMTIAAFAPAVRKGGFGFAKGLASFTIRLYTGLQMKSPMSGQRAMTAAVARALGSFDAGWGIETAMTIDVHRMGFRVEEVPTGMVHAETGRDLAGFHHRFGQFRAVARVLLTRALYRRRLRR